jgi:hypothetical protein
MIAGQQQSRSMATGYQAIARLRPVDVSREREQSVVELFRQALPEDAVIEIERDADGELLISVAFFMTAADASEVQIGARDLVAKAAERAGFTLEAALVDDIAVRSGS